jgi:O-antigen ligase
MKTFSARLASVSHRLFQFSFVALALFIPFSIAGDNFAIGFGLLAWLLAAIARRKTTGGVPPYKKVVHDPLFWAAVALAASALPSMLISENLERAWKDWRSYWLLCVCFLVAANIATHRVREIAFWVLFASISISCVVAFVQRAGGLDFGFIHIGEKKRVESTLYTMTFAGILYQTILLCLSVALRRGAAWRTRLILWAGLLVQFVAILLTVTRGAWIALFAGLAAVCLLIRNRLVLLFGIGVVAAVLVFAFANARHTDRNVSPVLLAQKLDVHARTRLVLWDIAWDLFRDNPVLGVGMGDYSLEADKRVGDRTVTTTTDTHNVYLQVLATRGLVGFIPFVLFWFYVFRSLFRVRGESAKGTLEWHYAVGAIGAAVAILFGALTENNVDDEEVFIAFMFVLGLALSADYVRGRAGLQEGPAPVAPDADSAQNGDTAA